MLVQIFAKYSEFLSDSHVRESKLDGLFFKALCKNGVYFLEHCQQDGLFLYMFLDAHNWYVKAILLFLP